MFGHFAFVSSPLICRVTPQARASYPTAIILKGKTATNGLFTVGKFEHFSSLESHRVFTTEHRALAGRVDFTCEQLNNVHSFRLYHRPQTKFAKVMFLHVSVILFRGGGGLPQCMLGYHPPLEQTPLPHPGIRHPPSGIRHPWSGHPPGPGTPWSSAPWTRHPRSRHPTPEQTLPLRSSACREILSASGRYASYRNAILLIISRIKIPEIRWSSR